VFKHVDHAGMRGTAADAAQTAALRQIRDLHIALRFQDSSIELLHTEPAMSEGLCVYCDEV
jgi:hypothetical protein